MRQGQHSKRNRGRTRRPSNPINRVYESNGPDVKIRGTAAHITEKYQVLARDAQVRGDRVVAENHLQHAEHYYRIVLATQPPAPARDNGQATSDVVAGQHDAETPPVAAEAENAMESAESAEPVAARPPHRKHTKGNGAVRTQNQKSDNTRPGEPGESSESSGQPAAEPQTGEENPAQKEQDGNQEAFV